MNSNLKTRFYFILATVFLSLLILLPNFVKEESLPKWWKTKPLNLGLDLKGGTYLVLRVQTKEAVKSRLATIARTVRRDLKRDAKILRSNVIGNDTIEFTLLDESGIDQISKHVREEFPELSAASQEGGTRLKFTVKADKAKEIEQGAVDQAIETIRNRVDQYGVKEPTIQRVGNTDISVQLPDLTDLTNVKKTIGSVAKLEFRLLASGDASVPTRRFKNRDGSDISLEDEVLMSGDSVDTAQVDINPQNNQVEVLLRLTPTGRKIFDDITKENVGRNLAIVLDGVVQSAPNIRERISAGSASISGGFTSEEARQLAIVLRSGALPAPLTFEEQRTVGASLGSDSIKKGVRSMLIGSLIVIAFMVVYYKKAGVLAVASLLLNVVFLMALLALLEATLTLPGIAGLVLTVGMAVDANVIIFERIKEELRVGAGVRASVEAGYEKAHWTILDANITTLLTGLILFGFGTGPIKGFAATLCLGVLTSVFSALIVSKVGFDLFKLKNSKDSLSI